MWCSWRTAAALPHRSWQHDWWCWGGYLRGHFTQISWFLYDRICICIYTYFDLCSRQKTKKMAIEGKLGTRRWTGAKLWSKMPNHASFGCGIHWYRLRNSLDSSPLRFQRPPVKKWPFTRCGGGGWLFLIILAHFHVNKDISDDFRGLKHTISSQNFPRNPKKWVLQS